MSVGSTVCVNRVASLLVGKSGQLSTFPAGLWHQSCAAWDVKVLQLSVETVVAVGGGWVGVAGTGVAVETGAVVAVGSTAVEVEAGGTVAVGGTVVDVGGALLAVAGIEVAVEGTAVFVAAMVAVGAIVVAVGVRSLAGVAVTVVGVNAIVAVEAGSDEASSSPLPKAMLRISKAAKAAPLQARTFVYHALGPTSQRQ